jgi:hypothetical protein
MSVCTTTEVFDFMGTGDQERNSNTEMLTGLISRITSEVENYIGRKIESTAITSAKFHDGYNCDIIEHRMYLTGQYYDLYSITTLTEDDETLTEGTDFVLIKPGILERIDAWWAGLDQLNIVITGKVGLVDSSSELTLPAIKQLVIEEVAARCGLWGKIYDDGQGNTFQTQRTQLSSQSKKRLDMYRQTI